MTLLVEQLETRVRVAVLSAGIARSAKDPVPRRLAQLLTLPLFDWKAWGSEEPAIVIDGVPEVVDFCAPSADEPPESWTLQGILQLHSVLLEQSLKALGGDGNGEQKREILEWLFEPNFIGTVERYGRTIPIYARQVPFSFVFCCRLEGMDPDGIRDQIRRILPAETKHFFN